MVERSYDSLLYNSAENTDKCYCSEIVDIGRRLTPSISKDQSGVTRGPRYPDSSPAPKLASSTSALATVSPDHSAAKTMSPNLFIFLTTMLIVEFLLILILTFAHYTIHRRSRLEEAKIHNGAADENGDENTAKGAPALPPRYHCHGVDPDDIEAGGREEDLHDSHQRPRTPSHHSTRGDDEMVTQEIQSSTHDHELELETLDGPPAASGQPVMDNLEAVMRELEVRGQEAQRRRLRNPQPNPRMTFADWVRMDRDRVELERLRMESGRGRVDGGVEG